MTRYPDGDLRIPLPKQAVGRNVGSPEHNKLEHAKSAQTNRPVQHETVIDLGATHERLEDKFMADEQDPKAMS